MDNNSKIACCNICLLSTFADCKACPFNPDSLKLSADERAQVRRAELLTQSQPNKKEN